VLLSLSATGLLPFQYSNLCPKLLLLPKKATVFSRVVERELLGMMTMWEVSRVDIFATGPQARSTLYVSNTTTLMQGGRLLLSEASDVPRSVQPPWIAPPKNSMMIRGLSGDGLQPDHWSSGTT